MNTGPEVLPPWTPVRRVTPYEWLYLAASPHFAPFAIQLRVALARLPERTLLEAAIQQAASANPGARLRVRGRRWHDSGLAPQLRLPGDALPFTLAHPALHQQLGIQDTPLLEVLYWPGCGLIFRCSHALMDAAGLLLFAKDVFRILRGTSPAGTACMVSDHDYLKARAHAGRRPFLKADQTSPLGPPAHAGRHFVQAHATVPGQVVTASARMAAFMASMCAGQPCRLMMPVDLRRKDATLRSTANLSNPLFLSLQTASDWNTCYRDIITALRRHDELRYSALDGFIPMLPRALLGRTFDRYHARQVRRGAYLTSATLSHLGSVALSDFATPQCTPDAVSLLPFNTPGTALSVESIQHDHGLEISLSCPAASGDGGRLEAFLRRLCDVLARPASGQAVRTVP